MKIFGALLFLFLTVNALAQSSSITFKDTSAKLIIRDAPTNPHSKPLIILDDAIYKGSLKNIKSNDIMSVDVLKGKNATDVYGASAKDGAIVIKTKKWRKVDTTSKAIQLDSAVSKDALFVVDGQPSRNKLGGVDPNDIISIDILKKGKGSDATFEPVNDIVVVVTKANAVKQYQKKFSSFSNQYRELLNQHHNDDNNITYIVDGVILNDDKERIIKLYKLPVTEIENFGFNNEKPMDSKILATVIINTKK